MSTKSRGRHHADQSTNAEVRERPAEKAASHKQEVSEDQRSRLIHVRAYGLWEQAGKPDGDEARERFWREARNEINASLIA